MIKNLINKKLKYKSEINERESPSRKLCDDIPRDYYGINQSGHFVRLVNKNGFLNNEFCINGIKYSSICGVVNDELFEIIIKDKAKRDVFLLEVLYGVNLNNPNQHMLYINKFCRLSGQKCGMGSRMADFIKDLAESRGFRIIGVNPVAVEDGNNEYMNQEELVDFYERHLNGNNVKLEIMKNSDCVSSVGWKDIL